MSYDLDKVGVETGDEPGTARFGHGMRVTIEIANEKDTIEGFLVSYSVDWALSAVTTLPGEKAWAKADLGFVYRVKGGAVLSVTEMVEEEVLSGEDDWSESVLRQDVYELLPHTIHEIVLGEPDAIKAGRTGLISEVYAMTPVPLPAGAPLLAGAFCLAAILRRRRLW